MHAHTTWYEGIRFHQSRWTVDIIFWTVLPTHYKWVLKTHGIARADYLAQWYQLQILCCLHGLSLEYFLEDFRLVSEISFSPETAFGPQYRLHGSCVSITLITVSWSWSACTQHHVKSWRNCYQLLTGVACRGKAARATETGTSGGRRPSILTLFSDNDSRRKGRLFCKPNNQPCIIWHVQVQSLGRVYQLTHSQTLFRTFYS